MRDLLKLSLTPEETSVPLFDNRGELLPVETWARRKKPGQFILGTLAVLFLLCGLVMLIYFFIK